MINENLEHLIKNNGKIISSRQNINSYLIHIEFIDYTKRNNRKNKLNNKRYWTSKLKKGIENDFMMHFLNDNNVYLWITKNIKEERKIKLKKLQNDNKK